MTELSFRDIQSRSCIPNLAECTGSGPWYSKMSSHRCGQYLSPVNGKVGNILFAFHFQLTNQV